MKSYLTQINCLTIFAAAFFGADDTMAQSAQNVGSVSSDNTTIEEIRVYGKFIGETGRSALKSDVPLRDVPLTVVSYTEDFMRAVEAIKLADLYDYMTGVQRSGPTAYDLNIRGFASGGADRNAIMIDGLPGLAVRFGSPPTINAERIEVVKGPASVLYGKVQPGGFVNIVLKKPKSQPMTMIRLRPQFFYGNEADAGDSSGYTLQFDSTGQLGNDDTFLYRVIAEYGDNPGFRNFGEDDNRYLLPMLTWNVSDETSLTGFFEYHNEDGNFDDGLVAPRNAQGVFDADLISPDTTTNYQEPDAYNNEDGTTLGLSFTHNFTDDVEWRGNFRITNHDDQRSSLDIQGTRTCHPSSFAGQLDPTAVCVRRRQRVQTNERDYYFGDVNVTWDVGTGSVTHKLLFGVNAGREITSFRRDDFGVNNDTYDIFLYNPIHGQFIANAPVPGRWDETTYDTSAAYVSDQISFGDQWKLLVAGRYEDFETVVESPLPPSDPAWAEPVSGKGDAVVPMVGLLYQPNDSLTYYVSYSESFNPPRPGRFDMNFNPFTTPEEGVQYEAGIKADLWNDRGNVTLSVFSIARQNSLQQVGTSQFYQLTGEEESTGFEIEGDVTLTDWWQVLAGYSNVDAKVKNDEDPALIGQQLRNSPKTTASVWNRFQVSEKMSLGLGINYSDDRLGVVPNSAGEVARLKLSSYTLVDFGVYYFNEESGIDASIKINNLLDEEYYSSAFSPVRINVGAPSNVTFSIGKSFY